MMADGKMHQQIKSPGENIVCPKCKSKFFIRCEVGMPRKGNEFIPHHEPCVMDLVKDAIMCVSCGKVYSGINDTAGDVIVEVSRL